MLEMEANPSNLYRHHILSLLRRDLKIEQMAHLHWLQCLYIDLKYRMISSLT